MKRTGMMEQQQRRQRIPISVNTREPRGVSALVHCMALIPTCIQAFGNDMPSPHTPTPTPSLPACVCTFVYFISFDTYFRSDD